MQMSKRALIASVAMCLALASPAAAQKKYDPGASDTEIRIGGVVPHPILTRAAMNLRHALAAQPFVGEQGGRRRVPIRARQDRRQRHAVFDRLIGALSEVRKHGMRGIAKQAQPLLGPDRQRLAII